jgi:hypothetical protein
MTIEERIANLEWAMRRMNIHMPCCAYAKAADARPVEIIYAEPWVCVCWGPY